MLNYDGKVAIVTGSGQGIGRQIALTLAGQGADVGILDMNEKSAAETVELIRALGRRAVACQVDISVSSQVHAAAQKVIAELGKVDVLVNNAGWDILEPFVESKEETWDKVLAINLRGPITLTRAVLDGMMERKYGKIVSISSDAARAGSKGECVYSAAKAGILGFTKTLAREMASYRINVNAVCPGPTETPLYHQVAGSNPKLNEALVKSIPMARSYGHVGQPSDIANAVTFLASDEARWITGQTLSVSGGLYIG